MLRLFTQLVFTVTHSARLILGIAFLILGVLGVILPLIPGTPWLIIGTLLVGRRSRVLRRVSVGGKQFLRRWATVRSVPVSFIGRQALGMQQETSRLLRRITWRLAARQTRVRRRAASSN